MKRSNKEKKKSDELLKENKKPPKSNKIEEEDEENAQIEGEDHTKHMDVVVQDENEDNNGEEKEEDPNANKIMIEVKPREDYLKEKISKSGYDEHLVSSVSKSIDKTMKHVESDFFNDNLLITEVKRDFTQLLPKKKTKKINILQHFSTSQRLHLINELKERQNALNNNLIKIKANEKLMEDEGFLNLKNNIDINKKKADLKEIKEKKENLISRIEEINLQINKLLLEEKNKNFFENKKITIKNFIDNLERDREIAEERAKKYEEDQKRREEKRKRDLEEISERIKQEIEDKKRKEEEENKKKIDDFMNKQRKIVNKRIQDNNEKLTQIKIYINEKPPKTKDDYLYTSLERNFQTKEENVIMKEKAKRKAMKRSVQIEELESFRNKIDEQMEELAEKNRQRRMEEIEEWKSKIALPDYHFPVIEETDKDIKQKEKEELIEKTLQNKEKLLEKIKSQKIRIDEKKQKERLEMIQYLTESKEERAKRNKDTLFDYKKKRILMKKRDPNSQSSDKRGKKRITWELKLDPIDVAQTESQKKLIRKPKMINVSNYFEHRKNVVIPDKPIDYLAEQIKNRSNNQRSATSETKKWNKLIKNNKNTLLENVENVKYRVQKLENEARQKERFLKLNGGLENFPEIGEKVSALLIDSIKGKLSILNTVSS